MNSIAQQKQHLRGYFRNELRVHAPEQRQRANTDIVKKIEVFLASHPEFTTIGAFHPYPSEPDITPLFRRTDKTFAFAVMENDHMVFDPPIQDFNVLLIPGRAFDRGGYRLGRSGGMYDRWLSEHPQPFRLGVGYALQLVKELPIAVHDEPLDALITEKEVLTFDKRDSSTSPDRPTSS